MSYKYLVDGLLGVFVPVKPVVDGYSEVLGLPSFDQKRYLKRYPMWTLKSKVAPANSRDNTDYDFLFSVPMATTKLDTNRTF